VGITAVSREVPVRKGRRRRRQRQQQQQQQEGYLHNINTPDSLAWIQLYLGIYNCTYWYL